MKRVIHWFRRDFRITDNTALAEAAARAEEVIPVYIVSDWKRTHRWTGPMRQQFLCKCLESLKGNLESIGSTLVLRQGEAIVTLAKLVKETQAMAIFYNRDPDPYGREIEKKLKTEAQAWGVEIRDFKDATIHEGEEVLNASKAPFRVFTPYSKAWAKLEKPSARGRLRSLKTPRGIASDPLPTLETWGLQPEGEIVEAGEKAARERLSRFLDRGLAHYGATRNTPFGDTSSRLSQDLRFGLLSIREIYARVQERMETFAATERGSASTFVNELIWREFYMAVLSHWPEVLEEDFNPKFRHLKWPGNPGDFEKWCAGVTGFPIVDAGMRQLNATGYMPNRVRMIVAMFLTKDLLIHWKLGEAYFMQKLVDGEIASNNGGWQWSAGTGADAAPYFRIQNPWTQAERYDPEAKYIRQWVPELSQCSPEDLIRCPKPGLRIAKNYPAPMLDHGAARERALEFFKSE